MTNSKWVALHFLCKAVPTHLFLCPTGCKWHCTSWQRLSHHIFSYVQQQVSEAVYFVKGSLISFSMTNSKWVTSQILWKAVSLHIFFQWPTASEWHCTLCERQSWLSWHFPMTNSKWVTLHILLKTVSWHLFLCPTASEWDYILCERQFHYFLWLLACEWLCTFCERQFHHIFFQWSTVSEWHCALCERQSWLLTSFPMTNSLWVTL